MTEYIGYTALLISLLSITMSNMVRFRWLHIISSSIYLIYGYLIGAMPLIVGATLFVIIHSIRLYKMYKAPLN